MAGFSVGAIVSELRLDKKGWDASVKSVNKQQKTMTEFAKKHGAAMKKMGRSMTIAGAAILGGLAVAVKAFGNFDKAMTESLAIMGNVSDGLKKEMGDAAKEMSTKSTFAAKELAEAYFFLASAGLDAKSSIAALPVVTKFAQAGNFQLALATDLLTDAQSALGLTIRDDVIKNQENMIRVSDLLVGANTLANASVKQFAESLTNRAAAALRAVNKPMEEGVAVLAAFADQGRKGSEAGMALDIVLRDLQKAARDNEEAFTRVGVTVFDSTGKLSNMGDIIGDLEVLLEGMSDKQKGATLATLGFQERSISNIKTLLGTSSAIKEYQTKLEDMAGITDEVSRKQLETFSNRMTIVKNKMTIAAIEIGERLAPTIEKLATIIGNVATKISKWIEKHPKLTTMILKVVGGLGLLMAIFGPILMILPGIIAAVGLMSSTFVAAASAIAIVVAVFGFTITRIIKLIKVMKGLKKAREEANKSIKLNAEVLKTADEKLRDVAKSAGLTAKEYENLKNKYDGNVTALQHAIHTGKESKELQEALAATAKNLTKETEDQTKAAIAEQAARKKLLSTYIISGEQLKDLIDKYGSYRKALKAVEDGHEEYEKKLKKTKGISEALVKIVKEMTKEIKEAALSEYKFRVWTAEQTYKERKALLDKEGAAKEDFVSLEKSRAIELAKIDEERTSEAKEFWRGLVKVAKEARDKLKEQEATLTSEVNQLVMDKFQFALWAEEERFKKQKKSIKDTVKNEKSKGKQLILLEKRYDKTITKIRDEMLADEKQRIQELKEARRRAFEEMVSTVNDMLGQVGSIFQGLFDLKMNLLDKEEKATQEAIDKQFNDQIQANKDIVKAEEEKSEEIYDSINADYEAKKKFIVDNITDEEERNKALAALEAEHNLELANARTERESAETATAEALLAVEEAKNEAIRLASEELEKKRTEARQEAAKQEKAVAILMAVVNTAAAVVKALTLGFPLGWIQAALVAIAGGIQIAVIKSTPLPMAKGGIVTEETVATIGEAGPEAVIPLDKLETLIQATSTEAMKKQQAELQKEIEKLAQIMAKFQESGKELTKKQQKRLKKMQQLKVELQSKLPTIQHDAMESNVMLQEAIASQAPREIASVAITRNLDGRGDARAADGKKVEVNIRLEVSPTFTTFDPMTMRDVWREHIEPQMLESFSVGGKSNTRLKEIMGVT